MTLSEKISAPGPKRILALDGGGIGGIITLEILAKIEGLFERNQGVEMISGWRITSILLRGPVPGRLSASPCLWG